MKYFYLTLLLIISAPALIKAQSNFKPGYLIDLKGDTIRGLVDIKEWNQNPDRVDFKLNDNSPVNHYLLDNMLGFGVPGNSDFEKFELPVSLDYADANNTTFRTIDSTVNRKMFLKVVSTGKLANLYSYTDLIKTRFFIRDNDDKHIEELIYHFYYSGGLLKTVTRYKTQLQFVAQNTHMAGNTLARRIQTANYLESDLTKIVQMINQNKSGSFSAEKLFASRFFIGASYVNTSLSYNHSNPNASGTLHHSSPKLNAGIDLIFNKKTQQVFFRVETGYSENKFSFPLLVNSFARYDNYVNQKVLSLAPVVVYNAYASDNFKIFVAGGFLYNYYNYDNYDIYSYSTDAPKREVSPDLKFQRSSVHILLKTGVMIYRHLELNFGYATTTEVSVTNSAIFKMGSYQAGFNFLF
ncbi:hypothetical protein A0256_07120 [Mucilaginibacter sp. PAMC 26640]|nr:hypothetical protein A0256_07120 [Mucilaginibacter sp. PAMC 26640]